MTSSTDAKQAFQPQPPLLSAAEIECLRCIAGHMIPASTAFGVPGADDERILADMAGSLGRDGPALAVLLKSVDAAAGGRLVALDPTARASLLSRMRSAEPAAFAVVEAVVSRAYYRDDRVLASIGMDVRPPFPRGYDLPATDWSLLDPVREGGPLWRPVD
jgi:hypothetical protein